MTARAGAVALACTLLFLAPASAGATSVSETQMRTLAAQAAAGNAAALAELRAVDQVDGAPANLAGALDTSDPGALHARLRALAFPGPSGATPNPGEAQATAAAVLHQRQYGRAPLPDPIGTLFSKLGHFIGKLAAGAPGGPVVFWLIVAVVLLLAATVGARRMMRRLDPARRTASGDDAAGDDPRALEAAADAAEARGAFDEAVRLRFQAGLMTLGERGRLAYRPSLLTGEARRALHSPAFDDLAASFEQVAYAHASADERRAAAAREGWRAVLAGSQERA